MARGPSNKSILSFNAGELSPKLDARVDLEKYSAGCRTLQNAIVEPYGCAVRRAGTQYVASTKFPGSKSRLIGFRFSTTTNRMLEFGNGYVRFLTGGTAPALITSGGSAVEVAAPWGTADLFELQTCQINDVVYVTHQDHPPYKLSRVSDTVWTLAEVDPYYPPMLDENVDESRTLWLNDYTQTTDWATATAYVAGDVRDNSGVIYICLEAHTSGTFATDLAAEKWEVYNLLSASAATFQAGHVGSYWQLAHLREAGSIDLAIAQPADWLTSTAYVVGDIRRESATNYVCLGDHTSGTFATDLAADKWEVSTADLTSPTLAIRGAWNVRTYGIWNADIEVQRSLDDGGTWETIRKFTGREDRNVDASGEETDDALLRVVLSNVDDAADAGTTTPRVVLESVDAYVYGLVQILGVIDSVNARVRIIDEPLSYAATPYWAEGAWSDVRGYPRAVTLHEQRLVFGGTTHQPQTFWGSKTADYENFRRGTLDTDSFVYTLGATEFNAILWFVSQDDLMIGTSSGEWVVWSGENGLPITPSSVNAVRQTEHGSKAIAPLVVNDNVIFVQRQGRKVREFAYSEQVRGYIAPDLTILSEHVTKGGIIQTAYQQQANSILWAVTGNGVLIGLTYEPAQNVSAWHRHVTDGVIESVATIYGDEGDEVWLVVKRTINGSEVRYIERINPASWTVKADCFFVDCGKTVTPSGTAVTGLSHLEGRTVQVLADGCVEENKVVSGGAITLTNAASKAQVGLAMETVVKPMKLETDPQLGNTQNVIKQVRNLAIRVQDTLGLKYGDGVGAFEALAFRDTDDVMDDSPALFTGEKEVEFPGDFDTEGNIVIKQDQPLPLTLLAIVVKHRVTGI